MSTSKSPQTSTASPVGEGESARGWWTRGLLLVFFLMLIVAARYLGVTDYFSLESISDQEAQLREFQHEHPIAVFGVAVLLYAAVTGLSLPVAVPLSLAFGWFFGLLPAVAVVSFGSTGGATVAFLFSRYLFRDSIQAKFGERLAGFNQALEREGAFYLFTLRLIPQVPFFLINVVMGLTQIRVSVFWIVSQIGMLPGTVVYVYAGASIPNAEALAQQGLTGLLSPQLWIAFGLLGIFPIVVKKLMNRLRPIASTD